MEKIDIKLDENCEILIPVLNDSTTLKLSIDKIKEFVQFLEVDEIIDSIENNNQINGLIDRLIYDYEEIIINKLKLKFAK